MVAGRSGSLPWRHHLDPAIPPSGSALLELYGLALSGLLCVRETTHRAGLQVKRYLQKEPLDG